MNGVWIAVIESCRHWVTGLLVYKSLTNNFRFMSPALHTSSGIPRTSLFEITRLLLSCAILGAASGNLSWIGIARCSPRRLSPACHPDRNCLPQTGRQKPASGNMERHNGRHLNVTIAQIAPKLLLVSIAVVAIRWCRKHAACNKVWLCATASADASLFVSVHCPASCRQASREEEAALGRGKGLRWIWNWNVFSTRQNF